MFLLSHWAFDRRAQWVKITFDLILIRERSESIALSIFKSCVMSYFELFLPGALYMNITQKVALTRLVTLVVKKSTMDHFWHLSKTYLNVNVARFPRNV